jgi:hypothetical protein
MKRVGTTKDIHELAILSDKGATRYNGCGRTWE